MNENGYFNIVGRIKDMIIRGGTNIFPTEIENLIHQHPKVENVQVKSCSTLKLQRMVQRYHVLLANNKTVQR